MGSILGNSVSNEIYFVYGLIAVVLILIVVILMMDHKEKKRLHKNLFNNKVLKKNLKHLEETGELPVVVPKKEEPKPIIPIVKNKPIILSKTNSEPVKDSVELDPIDEATHEMTTIKVEKKALIVNNPKFNNATIKAVDDNKNEKVIEEHIKPIKKIDVVKKDEIIKESKPIKKEEIVKETQLENNIKTFAVSKEPQSVIKSYKTPEKDEIFTEIIKPKGESVIEKKQTIEEAKAELDKKAKTELLDIILETNKKEEKPIKHDSKSKSELLDEILENKITREIPNERRIYQGIQTNDFIPRIVTSEDTTNALMKRKKHQEEMKRLSEISQIEYDSKEEELSKTQAQLELAKITEQLEENDNDLVKQTSYEQEQEETAIISIDELMKRSDELYDKNEKNQYLDEMDSPITIEELKKKVEQENQTSIKVNPTSTRDNAYHATTGSSAYISADDIETI